MEEVSGIADATSAIYFTAVRIFGFRTHFLHVSVYVFVHLVHIFAHFYAILINFVCLFFRLKVVSKVTTIYSTKNMSPILFN